jgi:hypothetical protein
MAYSMHFTRPNIYDFHFKRFSLWCIFNDVEGERHSLQCSICGVISFSIVELSPCLTKHRAVKTYGEWRYISVRS